MKKICIVCGKEFDTEKMTVKTCSPECSREAHRRAQQRADKKYYDKMKSSAEFMAKKAESSRRSRARKEMMKNGFR